MVPFSEENYDPENIILCRSGSATELERWHRIHGDHNCIHACSLGLSYHGSRQNQELISIESGRIKLHVNR